MSISNFLNKTKNEENKLSKDNVDDLFSVSSEKELKLNDFKNSDLNLLTYWNNKDDTSIISIVNDIILDALRLNSSDIHIEPRDKNIQVRFRVDGWFIKYKLFDIKLKDSLIARLKIMAFLRIDEHRLPQDWKINYKFFWWKNIDMRVSVMPTIYWEKIVIRLLKKTNKPPELKTLWILPYNMVLLKKHLKDTYWMILVVWPTWSWKSTSLFSLLSQFNSDEKNISTLEDPVEYRIDGVNHIQINPEIDFNFAKWLRSLLRQDPDIIMLWEIRDEETAKLAIEASITWHIVFSTLHTNSAVHSIQRLVNLWVDPLLISSSLRLIISQRLARKLCTNCKEKYEPSIEIKNYIFDKIWKYIKDKETLFLYKHKVWWCVNCNHTWYKGRIWLYEVLEMTDRLEALILKWASKTQLEIQAIWDGMLPIKEDGLLKVVLWETSIEEVLTVLWT